MSNVYFIRCGTAVKIGVATDLRGRLSAIQIGSPEPMRIIATIPNAGLERERELHDRFASQRIRGEWFSLEGNLAAFIETLAPYEREADPHVAARRFLSGNTVRVDRGDRWVKCGTLYRRYALWCQERGWQPLDRAEALDVFFAWLAEHEFRISGGTSLRPRWVVWGAAIAA